MLASRNIAIFRTLSPHTHSSAGGGGGARGCRSRRHLTMGCNSSSVKGGDDRDLDEETVETENVALGMEDEDGAAKELRRLIREKGSRASDMAQILDEEPEVASTDLLFLAIAMGSSEGVRMLTKARRKPRIKSTRKVWVDINFVNNKGRTPLLEAALSATFPSPSSASNEGVLEILLPIRGRKRIGTKMNVVDGDGNTVLHLIVSKKNVSIISDLLEAGADASLKNKQGKTAWMLADELQLSEISGILRKADPTAPELVPAEEGPSVEIPDEFEIDINAPVEKKHPSPAQQKDAESPAPSPEESRPVRKKRGSSLQRFMDVE